MGATIQNRNAAYSEVINLQAEGTQKRRWDIIKRHCMYQNAHNEVVQITYCLMEPNSTSTCIEIIEVRVYNSDQVQITYNLNGGHKFSIHVREM